MRFSPQSKFQGERLQYPAHDEYGYFQPVGTKKYSSKPSETHKLIFNHDLPQANPETLQHSHVAISGEDLGSTNVYKNSFHRQLKTRSITGNNYSQVYSPSKNKTIQYKYSDQPIYNTPNNKFNHEGINQFNQGDRSRLNKSINASNYKQKQSKTDQLDKLVSRYDPYDLKFSKKRQHILNEILKERFKHNSYLSSQL